jgi:uncharacterized damage-inducible protein DinB
MDKNTLIAALDFSHTRLLDELATIEKSGQDMTKVLAWRPGPGRAHLGWQFAHCAATQERYLKKQTNEPMDEKLVADFAGGSTPSDSNVPTVETIRSLLETKYAAFKNWVANLSADEMKASKPVGKTMRTTEETIVLLTWHEAHHHGQIHLTWNLYKAAHGLSA